VHGPMARIELPLCALFKNVFGDAGLSSQILPMAAADIRNYWKLFRKGHLDPIRAVLFSLYAAAKFIPRIARISVRRALQSIATTGGPALDRA
jgi:hypothetical protein